MISRGKMKKSSKFAFFLNQEITRSARTISQVLRHISQRERQIVAKIQQLQHRIIH